MVLSSRVSNSSNRSKQREVAANSKQKEASMQEEKDLAKETKKKQEKAQERTRIWQFNMDRQEYKCYSLAEGAQPVQGAAVKGRDDWYGIITVFKGDGV